MNGYPLRSGTLKTQQAGRDVLVHDPDRGKIHVLNATAAKVLEACDGATGVHEIAQRIAPENQTEAAQDIERIVEEFRRLGLLIA